MQGKLKDFEYFAPSTMSEVMSLLEQYGERAKFLAGGTDLLVAMKERRTDPKCLINLKGITELEHITFDEEHGLRIGALTKIRQIETSRLIQEKFPSLFEGAKVLGSVQVRNLATIGGNICTASPSADTVPSLLSLDASVKLRGSSGERILPLREFFVGPGMTVLSREVLTEIIVPVPSPSSQSTYLCLNRREAVDLALVGVAVAGAVDKGNGNWKNVRIALGAVAPTPIRAHKAEKSLEGKLAESGSLNAAAHIASEECLPISDVRASASYRKEMVKVLVERALEQIHERCQEEEAFR
jgi:carbon-monoxide dehydrogenase medium subunit